MSTQPRLTRTIRPIEQVICVDLDGTLVYSDTFVESFLRLVKRRPAALLWCLAWVLKGRAYLKRRVADESGLDPAELPYNTELLAYLEVERAAGAHIVLATGADERIARSVADYLGIFDEVVSSDGDVNLTGRRKSDILCARFGAGNFLYAGNSNTDLPVWRAARGAIVCNAGRSVVRRLARERIAASRAFPQPARTTALVARAMRLYQWPKNLLIAVPLFLSHRIGEPGLILKALIAMAAFGLCASALYLVNDLLDLPADRAHPRKRMRPFASGKLSLWVGIALAPSLIVSAGLLGALLGSDFLIVLCGYAVLSSTYSFVVKEAPLLDVCVLGGLYVVRIFAGGAAMGIRISSWTLGYSLFLFLSLALLKRYVELLMLVANKQTAARGRGYLVGDAPILASFGAATGCVAALLLALYIESEEVRVLYRNPQRLWLLCGIHLFWISRAWLIAHRGEMHHDPVLFALRDRATYALGAVAGVVTLLAT